MFTLPQLPYKYNELEPYIDARTMELHHTKHHQAYIDKLNAAISDYPDLHNRKIEEIVGSIESLPESIRVALTNHGGGHINHSLFWNSLIPGGTKPDGQINSLIMDNFGSFDEFKKIFSETAVSLFGSGWVWLELDNNKLGIEKYSLQENPLMKSKIPLLGLDVWEHAYYLKYQNKRAEYIEAWWNIINWNFVEKELEKTKK